MSEQDQDITIFEDRSLKKSPLSKNKLLGVALILVFIVGFGAVGVKLLRGSKAASTPKYEIDRQGQLFSDNVLPHTVGAPLVDTIQVAVTNDLGCDETLAINRYAKQMGGYVQQPPSGSKTCGPVANVGKSVVLGSRYSWATGLSRSSFKRLDSGKIQGLDSAPDSNKTFVGDPAIFQSYYDPGTFYMLATGSNGLIYYGTKSRTNWQFSSLTALPSAPVGIKFIGSPAVIKGSAPDTSGRPTALITVRGNNNSIYFMPASLPFGAPPVFSPSWKSIGPMIVSDPVMVNGDNTNAINVIDTAGYIFGVGGDKSLFYSVIDRRNETVIRGWTSLGGGVLGKPAVVRTARGESSAELAQVVVRGTNNRIYTMVGVVNGKGYNFGPTIGWQEVPGNGMTISDPALTYSEGGLLQIVVRGTDYQLYSNFQLDHASNNFEGWRRVPISSGRTPVTP